MISNSDLEKAWFLYKTEYEPQNISINDFCMRKGIPHREFNKWFRNTHKQVVPVEEEGIPDNSEPAPPQSDVSKVSNTMSPRKSGIFNTFISTCQQKCRNFRNFFVDYVREWNRGRRDYDNLVRLAFSPATN